MDKITIYTDGSCRNKDGMHGGYGIVLIYKSHQKHIQSDQYIHTTSARMEIRGVLEALRSITNKNIPIHLYCDNMYCVNAWRERWVTKWELDGWMNGGKERVNSDLWKLVLKEIRMFKDHHNNVVFEHVKGHSGNKYNHICDRLAAKGGQSEIIIKDIPDYKII